MHLTYVVIQLKYLAYFPQFHPLKTLYHFEYMNLIKKSGFPYFNYKENRTFYYSVYYYMKSPINTYCKIPVFTSK